MHLESSTRHWSTENLITYTQKYGFRLTSDGRFGLNERDCTDHVEDGK